MAGLALTWHGTNSWLIESPQASVLIDPFIQLPGGENPNTVEDYIEAGYLHQIRDILITHCHFDHLAGTPAILAKHPAIVYCTECGVPALQAENCPTDNIIVIAPGLEFDIADMHIRVLPGRHITFDAKLVAETLAPSHLASEKENIPTIMRYMGIYKEAKETVVYEVEANGLRLLFLGSLALQPDVDYPKGVDYLILPYQGNTHLPEIAREIIDCLEPRNIIASHFDNAFPPISAKVDLTALQEMVATELPGVHLIIPQIGRPLKLRAEEER